MEQCFPVAAVKRDILDTFEFLLWNSCFYMLGEYNSWPKGDISGAWSNSLVMT